MAFQPPPTWANPIITDEHTKKVAFNPVWMKWFVDLTSIISSIGTGGTAISHNGLTNLQGGAASEYYHLSSADYTGIQGGSWASPKAIGSAVPNSVKATTVRVISAGGYTSSDGSTGYTGTLTTASLVGKTVTIKDGIITSIA